MKRQNAMNYIKLIFLFIPLIFTGCQLHTFKDYSYALPKVVSDNKLVHGHLRGTWKYPDANTSINTSPYELILWITVPYEENLLDYRMEFKDISLKTKDGTTTVNLGSATAPFRKHYDGTYEAVVSFENLTLDYEDYLLSFSYQIKNTSPQKLPISVDLVFEQKYEEEKLTPLGILMRN